MVEYSNVNVKLSDTQLKKLKTTVKNKTGTALRIHLKMFNGNDLPHELILTTRQQLVQEFKKRIHGSGTTTLIISNEEMNDIMKFVQGLEDFNILLKGVTKTIKNETKEEDGGFLSILLGTLGASLLGNLLSGIGIVRTGSGNKKEKEL